MFRKTFALTAILAASQALKLQSDNKLETIISYETETHEVEEDTEPVTVQITPELVFQLFDTDQDGTLSRDEAFNAAKTVYSGIPETEFDMLFDYVWNSADLDQNGHVRFEELRAFLQGPSDQDDEEDSTELTQCLAYPNVDCVLALFDVDNEFDGLDYEEAQLAYSFFFPYDTTEDFEAAFDGLDQNEDGLISGEELAAVLGTKIEEETQEVEDRLQQLIAEFDTNNDGMWTKQEAAFAYWSSFPDGDSQQFEILWSILNGDNNDALDASELEQFDEVLSVYTPQTTTTF